MPHGVVGHPDRSVFRDGEMTLQDCKVHVFKDMRIIDRVQIKRGLTNPGDHAAPDFSTVPVILGSKMRVGLGEIPDAHGLAANEFQNRCELFNRIGKRLPVRHSRQIRER